MPKSSDGEAVSLTVSPWGAVPALAASVTVGEAALPWPGVSTVTTSPVPGSAWLPLRNGKKSTALDVTFVPPSGVDTPLTGFSGIGGLLAGEMAGPVLTSGVVLLGAYGRRP